MEIRSECSLIDTNSQTDRQTVGRTNQPTNQLTDQQVQPHTRSTESVIDTAANEVRLTTEKK